LSKRARASFSGLSLTTSTADLVRAVLEGVAANSAWLLGYVERFAGQRLEPLRLVGGGGLSTLWCQIYADTLGREVERVPQPMVAQLRGAALMAEVARGRMTLDDVAQRRTVGEIVRPQPDVADLYRARREDVPRLFKRERAWSRR
jgi:xylulokinase